MIAIFEIRNSRPICQFSGPRRSGSTTVTPETAAWLLEDLFAAGKPYTPDPEGWDLPALGRAGEDGEV